MLAQDRRPGILVPVASWAPTWMPQPSTRQKRFELASKRQARLPYYVLDIMTSTTTPVRKNLFADETGNFDFSRKPAAGRCSVNGKWGT